MANDPFTIRIFVPDGDPEGIRTIDRMNWTGLGIVFPREKWADARQRKDFDNAGVYILVGESENDEADAANPNSPGNLPTIYVGEGDGIRDRIDSHYVKKDFWSWGISFVSTNRGLNKAHVQWLEYALLKRAKEVGQCKVDNGNTPLEPALTESDRNRRGLSREKQISEDIAEVNSPGLRHCADHRSGRTSGSRPSVQRGRKTSLRRLFEFRKTTVTQT